MMSLSMCDFLQNRFREFRVLRIQWVFSTHLTNSERGNFDGHVYALGAP